MTLENESESISIFVRRDRKASFRDTSLVSAIVSVITGTGSVIFLEKVGPIVGGFIGKRLIAAVGMRLRMGSYFRFNVSRIVVTSVMRADR